MPDSNRSNQISFIGGVLAVVLGLYLSSRYSYLLFHGSIEIISIAIAFTLFILTWNTRQYLVNPYLRLLGIGYAFIALIDLLHALAYKGMGVFPAYGANLPTQLWIAARYLQALTLFGAPLFLGRKVDNRVIVGTYAASIAGLTAMIYSGYFPDCFIEGKGLTAFKISSEYAISALLLASLYFICRQRRYFSNRVFLLIASSIACTVISELSFTSYVSVYGFTNLIGHFAKLASFYLLYVAILVTGFKEPFALIFRDLKQAENVLTREREFSRCLLESMADGVVACDAEGALTLFNRTAKQWHGLDPMRLPQEEWARHYDLFRADGVTPLSTDEIPLAIAFNGEEVRDVGMAIVAKGQAPRFILANGSVILSEDGDKLGAVVVMRDTTAFRCLEQELRQTNEILERRVAERTAALRNSEEKFRSLIDKVQTAIVLHDGQGHILSSNPLAQELFGLSADQLLGKALIDPDWHFRREDGSVMPVAEYPVSLVLASKAPLRGYVTGISRPDREMVTWVLVNGEPECDETGEIVQVIVSFIDISERKRAEVQLQSSEHGLAEAQRIAHLGSWELDLVTKELSWSDEIYRIFEIAPEKFDASYEAFLAAIHPEDREMVNKAYSDSVKDRVPYNIVHRLQMADGRIKYVNEICETYYAEDGKPLRSVGTVHDITERKLDEEALQRLNRELRAIRKCEQVLVRAEDELPLLHDVCRIVCDEAGYRMAWVGYAENDQGKTVRPVAWAGSEVGYLAHADITWADTQQGGGPTGIAIRTGETDYIQDFATEPKAAPWRENALQRGFRSSIALPLKDESKTTFGSLTIYSSETNAFTADETRLLEELAGDLAFGVIVLRTRLERQQAGEELRRLNDELEERVQERTTELLAKNEELEQLNQIFVGRELKMVELKEKIKELEEGTSTIANKPALL